MTKKKASAKNAKNRNAKKKNAKKTTRNNRSVDAFLNTIKGATRRADCAALVGIMERATGHPPRMWGAYIVGFGAYQYTLESGAEGDAPGIAFSPRSTKFALYHMDFASNAALLARLGKHSTGKKCMYVTRLSEIDVVVLEKLCRRSFESVAAKHSMTA